MYAKTVFDFIIYLQITYKKKTGGSNPLSLRISDTGFGSTPVIRCFKESIRIDDEIRRIKGLPVARYDDETKRAYLEYPDGRREYVGQ